MFRVAGATMGAEERGARARVGATRTLQHFRRNDPGPTSDVDCRAVEGHLQLSEQRSWVIKPDGRLHRRPVYAPSRS